MPAELTIIVGGVEYLFIAFLNASLILFSFKTSTFNAKCLVSKNYINFIILLFILVYNKKIIFCI